MPATGPGPGTPRIAFDDAAFAADLAHSTPAARNVALATRRQMLAHGLRDITLHACKDDARDATRLPRCVKTYLPTPDKPWRMVFEVRSSSDGQLFLDYLAFGVGHPTRPGQPSVYQLAHRRLHATDA